MNWCSIGQEFIKMDDNKGCSTSFAMPCYVAFKVQPWPDKWVCGWGVRVGKYYALTFRGEGRGRLVKGPSCHGG